jgi:hypothetical protein
MSRAIASTLAARKEKSLVELGGKKKENPTNIVANENAPHVTNEITAISHERIHWFPKREKIVAPR